MTADKRPEDEHSDDTGREGAAPPTNAPGDTKPGTDKRKRMRILLIIALAFVLAGIIWLLLWIFVYSVQESTDDAYVSGNQVTVSAQVAGTVTAIMADNTDRVQAGQVLVKLDSTDARVELGKARNALAQSVRKFRQKQASAAQADAAVSAQKVALQVAQADLKRRQPLLKQQAVASETLAHLKDQVTTARAQLKVAEQKATAAHVAISGTTAMTNPAVLSAKAEFRKAWLAVHRTEVRAPVSGYVANRSVQLGNSISPGHALMQILPLDHLWVDANFKEGQLRHIRIGQPVTVESSIYGGDVTYHGKVLGMSPGTGSVFALLPPQNASGNWIKVVQRVPLRVSLPAKELRKHPLRIGLSAEVTVDTSQRSGQVLAQHPVQQPVATTSVYVKGLAQANHEADAIIRANMKQQTSASH